MAEIKTTDVRTAKAKIAEGALTIWNARLDLLERIGDAKAIYNHLVSPIDPVADGSGCDCGCGAQFRPEEMLGNPAARGK